MADPFNRILSKFCKKFNNFKYPEYFQNTLCELSKLYEEYTKVYPMIDKDNSGYSDAMAELKKCLKKNSDKLKEEIGHVNKLNEYLDTLRFGESVGQAAAVHVKLERKRLKFIKKALEDLAKQKLVIGSVFLGVGTAKYWKSMAKHCDILLNQSWIISQRFKNDAYFETHKGKGAEGSICESRSVSDKNEFEYSKLAEQVNEESIGANIRDKISSKHCDKEIVKKVVEVFNHIPDGISRLWSTGFSSKQMEAKCLKNEKFYNDLVNAICFSINKGRIEWFAPCMNQKVLAVEDWYSLVCNFFNRFPNIKEVKKKDRGIIISDRYYQKVKTIAAACKEDDWLNGSFAKYYLRVIESCYKENNITLPK